MAPKGQALLRAMYSSGQRAGVKVRSINATMIRPENILMLYGAGGSDRYPIMKAHRKAGGRVVIWDAGYWSRTGDDMQRHYRISIDELHPQAMVMLGERPSSSRWDAAGESVDHDIDRTNGEIMIVGCSPKSNAIGARGWAAEKSRELRDVFPRRKIVYRPKPKRAMDVGVICDRVSQEPLADALAKVSLVVSRHSNVSVDACRAGIPVVCDDGAAAAIYPSALKHYAKQPDIAARTEFLHRLAWWQWSTAECAAGKNWPWIIKALRV